ncbi:hypothetical protein FOZ63_012973, partial [Perkinsus olseni]
GRRVDSTPGGRGAVDEIDDTTTCSATAAAAIAADGSGISQAFFEAHRYSVKNTFLTLDSPSRDLSALRRCSSSPQLSLDDHSAASREPMERSEKMKKDLVVVPSWLGLPTFRFDFTGNGESEGEWDYGNYEQEATELEAAVKTLEERRKLKTLATIGHSRGATVVCLHCGDSSNTRIPLVVSLSGRYDMTHKPNRFTDEEKHQLDTLGYCDWYRPDRHDGPMRKYRWKKASIERIMAIDTRKMTEDCARRGSKLMFVQARDDPVVQLSDLYSFQNAFLTVKDTAKSDDCVILEVSHGGHSFSDLDAVTLPIANECQRVLTSIREGNGILTRPSSPSSDLVVIVCHGLFCDKTTPLISSIAQPFVTALGVCSFRFDFSGNGDSAGEWDCGDYHQEVLEIDAAVRMLREDEGLKTICLIGHSKGSSSHTAVYGRLSLRSLKYPSTLGDYKRRGTVVSMYAGANEVATRVPLIVSISGRFDLSAKPDDRFSASDVESLETVGYCDTVRGQKTFRWRKGSLQKMSAIDMIPIVQHCARKEDVSMLFIHAEGDDVVPVSDLDLFVDTYNSTSSAGRRCIKRKLPMGGHFFRTEVERQELLKPIFQALRDSHLGFFAMALVLVRRCKYRTYYYRGFSAFTYVSYDGEAGGTTKRLQKGFSNATTLAFESIDPFRRDWTKKAKTKKDRAVRDKRARSRQQSMSGQFDEDDVDIADLQMKAWRYKELIHKSSSLALHNHQLIREVENMKFE